MTSNHRSFSGELANKKGDRISVSSPVVIFEQNESKIIYSPALELYGYGKNLREAKSSLKTSLEEFINYTLNKGTFHKELERLGWEFKRRKREYIVPSFDEMLRRNKELIKIFDNNAAKIDHQELVLPVA